MLACGTHAGMELQFSCMALALPNAGRNDPECELQDMEAFIPADWATRKAAWEAVALYWLASWANEPWLKPPFDLLMLCHSQQFASNSDFFLGDAASGKLDGRCKLARKMKELVLASGMFQRLL